MLYHVIFCKTNHQYIIDSYTNDKHNTIYSNNIAQSYNKISRTLYMYINTTGLPIVNHVLRWIPMT